MLEKIHKQRSKIAVNYQAKFAPDIEVLNNELELLSLKHPYDLTSDQYSILAKQSSEYCNGGCCQDLKASSDDSYLYRYTTIENLTRLSNWEDSIVAIDNAFEIIKSQINSTTWFILSNAMRGFYKNRRGFSWWTNEVPNEIEKLFRLGLVNDWFKPKSLIMRTKLTEGLKRKLNIPSAIDGYDQPIFLPKFIEPEVYSGQTLNLNDLQNFKGGCKEFVVSELSVQDIEILPLELDVRKLEIRLDSIQEHLLNHYNKH